MDFYRKKRVARMVPLVVSVALLCGCGGPESDPSEPAARVWGGRGETDGLFVKPRAVAVDAQGRLFVVDMSGRIQRFDKHGRHELTWALPFRDRGFPTGLGIDRRNGTLLVAETHLERIGRYTPDGQALAQWGRPGDGPGEFTYATDVAAGPDGRVYVTEYGGASGRRARVMVFREGGEFLNEWGRLGTAPGEFQRPMALDIDGEGRIYVADSVNHRIQVFDTEGDLLRVWGSDGSDPGRTRYPWDVTVAPDGNIVVCEFGNNRVQKFTPDGRSIALWGRAGTAVGQLASPWGVAVTPDGFTVIVDALNHRLQVIQF